MRLHFILKGSLSSSSCCFSKIDGQSNAISTLETIFLPLRCISLLGSYHKPPAAIDKRALSTPSPHIQSTKPEHKYNIFGKKHTSRKPLFQKTIYDYLLSTSPPRKSTSMYTPAPPTIDTTLVESSDDTADQTADEEEVVPTTRSSFVFSLPTPPNIQPSSTAESSGGLPEKPSQQEDSSHPIPVKWNHEAYTSDGTEIRLLNHIRRSLESTTKETVQAEFAAYLSDILPTEIREACSEFCSLANQDLCFEYFRSDLNLLTKATNKIVLPDEKTSTITFSIY